MSICLIIKLNDKSLNILLFNKNNGVQGQEKVHGQRVI